MIILFICILFVFNEEKIKLQNKNDLQRLFIAMYSYSQYYKNNFQTNNILISSYTINNDIYFLKRLLFSYKELIWSNEFIIK